MILLLVLAAASVRAVHKSDDSYLNIPDEYIEFNDQSALKNKENLESKQYNDFIHTLYKFDADNLEKFEKLHHPDKSNSR